MRLLTKCGVDPEWLAGARATANLMEDTLVGRRDGTSCPRVWTGRAHPLPALEPGRAWQVRRRAYPGVGRSSESFCESHRVKLVAVAASDVRSEIFRLTPAGELEQRWLSGKRGERRWSSWSVAPFAGNIVDVAAISGWPSHIEVFVLDDVGGVWNRWWWEDRGWQPEGGFEFHGRPFGEISAQAIAALSGGDGHFNVFVEAFDGQLAMLPHLPRDVDNWQLCESDGALADGWWPAFAPPSDRVYR